jgi:hypothetical protein
VGDLVVGLNLSTARARAWLERNGGSRLAVR